MPGKKYQTPNSRYRWRRRRRRRGATRKQIRFITMVCRRGRSSRLKGRQISRRSILESRFRGEREKKALDEDPLPPPSKKKTLSDQAGSDKIRNGAQEETTQNYVRRASWCVRKKPGIQLGTQGHEISAA
uniref:Uncharacterized protein n=1 Tax=Micrurus corallinus TaxID=54390 RepID=A0A2D4FCA7_MICCO